MSTESNSSTFTLENIHDQSQSSFFELPGEVRHLIYTFVFAPFEDPYRPYYKDTFWYRPDRTSPLTKDDRFLYSCKRVYDEAQYISFSSLWPTLWLAAPERIPTITNGRHYTSRDLTNLLEREKTRRRTDVPEIDHVWFAGAQLYMLEPGTHLSEFLRIPQFRPRRITITIRHTDWWYWEQDQPLRIAALWAKRCKFPASTQKVILELETLERKKVQMDRVVDAMKRNWFFRRADDVRLTARTGGGGSGGGENPKVTRWQGSSTICDERWVRDEVAPNRLDYYVATLTFSYESDVALSQDWSIIEPLDIATTAIPLPESVPLKFSEQPFLLTTDLYNAHVPLLCERSEASRMIERFQARQRESLFSRLFRRGMRADDEG